MVLFTQTNPPSQRELAVKRAIFLWMSVSAVVMAACASSPPIPSVPGSLPNAERLLALERFSKWDEIFLTPPPPNGRLFTMGIWHYARGRALTQIMRIVDAEFEHKRVKEIAELDTMKSLSMTSPGTTGQDLLRIAERVLAGDIARAKEEWAEAITALESGVQLQDALAYSEPSPWYFPVRDLLGTVLLEAGEPAKAEAVFREQREISFPAPRQ